MFYSVVRLNLVMLSVFREPDLRLGLQATDVLQTFYKGLQASQQLNLNDLLTFGGNSYGDLKLTINTFRGRGRIDITPGGLLVELRDYIEGDKDHWQLCEDTLRKALKDVEISERHLRANIWAACEGGSLAVETFLGEKGNAALNLDQGEYGALKKEFTLQFSGLDASNARKVGLVLQRSTHDGDLFVQFDHTQYGSPSVTQTATEQFENAEKELTTLTQHVGLEPKNANVGRF
jgi:hypothetical protein